jgi:hypothetical protein
MGNSVGRFGVGRLLAVLAGVVAFSGTVGATPVPVDVSFNGGKGTLSGYFQTDSSGAVTTWDLTTSQFDCSPCTFTTGFPGLHYDPATSTVALGFFFGKQSVTFRHGTPGVAGNWQLDFILECGGNDADCLGNAQAGSKLNVTGDEMAMPDFLPFRGFTAALDVIGDPVFVVVPRASVPEPGTLLLGAVALAGLIGMRRKSLTNRN